jgi:putative addiction module component (TIGR02574 family)
MYARGGQAMNEQTLLASALALPEEQRMQLVEKLLESLDPETDVWEEAAFAAELQRRSKEIDDGTAQLVSWEQLKKEVI